MLRCVKTHQQWFVSRSMWAPLFISRGPSKGLNEGKSRMRMRLWIVSLVALTLTGCALAPAGRERGAAAPTSTPLARVTSAQVVRLVALDQAPAFSATIADSEEASSVYQAMLALKVDNGAAPSCPLDEGADYWITFRDESAAVLTAWVKPDGCRDAKIGASRLVYATTDQFWQTLASALGVSANSLFDLTYHGGPTAPPPGPGDWSDR